MRSSFPFYQAGPSRSTQTPVPRPAQKSQPVVDRTSSVGTTPARNPSSSPAFASPLPGPIRKSASALRTTAENVSGGSTAARIKGSAGLTRTEEAAAAALAAAKRQSSKTLADSYRSLAPNTRILLGLALGVVGLVGLYWDRSAYPEASREGDKPLVSVRVVDRER